LPAARYSRYIVHRGPFSRRSSYLRDIAVRQRRYHQALSMIIVTCCANYSLFILLYLFHRFNASLNLWNSNSFQAEQKDARIGKLFGFNRVKQGGNVWDTNTRPDQRNRTSPAFELTSKRRRGYPSETSVKRGLRMVHGDKDLLEKLGKEDLCPCGSGHRFQAVLP
jgi:hypothetical protein